MFSQVKRLVGDSFLYAFMSMSTKLIAFIMVPIYVHHLTTAEYGALGIIDATVSILTFLIIFGTDSALAYYYFEVEESDKKLRYVQNVLAFRLAVALALSLIIWTLGKEISLLITNSPVFGFALNISMLTLVLDTIVTLVITIYRYEMLTIRVVTLTVLKMGLIAVISYVFLVYVHGSLDSILFARLISVGAVLLLCGKSVLQYLKLSLDKEILKEVLKYSAPLVPATLSFWVIGSSNRYVMTAMLGPNGLDAAGIYHAAFQFASMISLLTYGIQMAWRPFSMQIKKKENSRELFAKIYIVIFVIGMLGIMAVTTLIPWIFQMLKKEYADAFQYVGFLSLVTFLSFYYLIISSGLLFTKRTKPISYAFGLGAVLSVILNIALVPFYQIWGTVIANLIAYIVAVAIIFYKSQQAYHIPVSAGKLIFILLQTILSAGSLVYIQVYHLPAAYQMLPWAYFIASLLLSRVDRDFRLGIKN